MKKAILLIFCLVGSLYGLSQNYEGRYELVNLGKKVNTSYHEGAPVISADGKIIYFFVHNHPDNTNGKKGSQDIWYSELEAEGQWSEARHMEKPMNQHISNQVFTVMPGGKTLLIRGGSSKNAKGFSFTHYTKGKWSKPDELTVEGFEDLNQGKFYGATISSDGKFMLLYFSEKKNNNYSDLYLSKAVGDNAWSKPVKLSSNINTTGDEFGPFLAPDNKTLYFSSTRNDMSIGKADIFKTVRLDDTWLKWSNPVNVGRPINTALFDGYISVDDFGNIYTAQSGNTIDGGHLDIFRLNLKDIKVKLRGLVLDQKSTNGISAATLAVKKRQDLDTLVENGDDGSYQVTLSGEGIYNIAVTASGYHADQTRLLIKDVFNDTTIIQDFYLKPVKRNALLTGTVLNAKTSKPIPANLTVSLKANSSVNFEKELATGYFERELQHKGWYLLTASSAGFLTLTDSIENLPDDVSLLNRDLYLTPIEVGTTVRLNDIFFDFDKTTLQSESFIELDKVVDFLNDNASLEIEIAGHTDSKGSDDYNRTLSQGRAEAVVDYLISKGINAFRLTAKGYGETVPLETNSTDEGRAYNRRVEFTVLKK